MACRCAQKALQNKFTVFGLQNYGECWSGPKAEFDRNGAANDYQCLMNLNDPTDCVQSSVQECVGRNVHANYIYKLTESKLNVIVSQSGGNTFIPASRCKFNVGVFHLMKNFGLNFRKLSMANGSASVTEYPEKRTTLRGIPKFSEITYRKYPFHLAFLPRFRND